MKFPAKQLLAVAAVFGGALALSSAAGAATLNIVGCDSFTGDISTGQITCVTGTTTPPPAGAPTGCTASATPSSLAASGGTVTLTGSCTGGTVAATTWKRNGTIVSAPDTAPSNSASSTPAYYSYTATFCTNADGTLCTTVSAGTVTVAAGVVAPPPAVGSCADQKLSVVTPYLETNSTVTALTFDGARFVTQGFTGSNVVVATIRVPDGESGATAVTAYEYSNSATGRRMWIAKTPCDFSNEKYPYYTTSTGPKLPIWIGAGGDPSKYVVMQPGETWYVMVRNQSVGFLGVTNTCKSGECNIAIKLY